MIKQNVISILTNNPTARNNDGVLCMEYWQKYFDGNQAEFILSNLQVYITALRRELQRKNPDLRGTLETWNERHKKCKKVRENIRQQERPVELIKEYGEIEKPKKSLFLSLKKLLGGK